MLYLLDANVLMHLVNGARGHERIRERLKSLRKSEFAISSITAVELWQKILAAKASKRAVVELQYMLNAVRVLPFTAKAAEHGGLVVVVTKEKGKPTGWPDAMLAAHALALGATVVTNNTKDFTKSGCMLEDWTI